MENLFCATWASSQYLTEPFNMPPLALSNNSLRQIVKASIGGKRIKIRFSNRCSDTPLFIKAVNIAKSFSQGSGKIIPSTLTQVLFDGKKEAVIGAGEELYSDIFDFSFDSMDELSVSIFFGEVPEKVTGHPGSRTFSFVEEGNKIEKVQFSHENKTAHWYVLAGIETETDSPVPAIVCFGDSITDGRGSTDDLQNRWTDNLSKLLRKNPDTKNIAVINQGIGGTCVNNNGKERFERDVISQKGIKYIIMLYGINDIIYMNFSAQALIDVYKDLIQKAHKNNIKIFGCTILPFGKCGDYTPGKNAVRKEVNTWIKNTSAKEGGFDGAFDFDELMKNKSNPDDMDDLFNCGDGLHPSAQGYEQMVRAFNDLSIFK